MPLGAEAFTVLAVLEARDRASEVFDRMSATVGRFQDVLGQAAGTAETAGAAIDTSMLQTASGADAAELAAARLSATRAGLDAATRAQAAAERDLLAAQQAAAGASDADAAAQERLAAAAESLATAKGPRRRGHEGGHCERRGARRRSAGRWWRLRDEQVAADDRVAAGRLGRRKRRGGRRSIGADGYGDEDGVAGDGRGGGGVGEGCGRFPEQHAAPGDGRGRGAEELGDGPQGHSGCCLIDGHVRVETVGCDVPHRVGRVPRRAGAEVLQTASEGAKVGGADFETVAKTLTGTMNSYGLSGDQADVDDEPAHHDDGIGRHAHAGLGIEPGECGALGGGSRDLVRAGRRVPLRR